MMSLRSAAVGGIVLAGGRSVRMGASKALLDWHGTPAVAHAVEVVRDGIAGGPICVVRAPGQELPQLDAMVVADADAHAGPLGGLLAGLDALAGRVEIAFACGVDTPLLVPAFVRAVCGALGDSGHNDTVVPVIGARAQPLLAAYRTAIAPQLRALYARGARGLKDIPDACAVRNLAEHELLADAELATADPRLRSAANANTPDEWAALLAEAAA
jgi:molybdopterin-guanine dinucleotide biosynthesis protein A